MKIKPLFDRVLLAPKQESETKFGLVLPNLTEERPEFATVVAVGDGTNLDNEKCEFKVEVGNTVLFNKYVADEIKMDDKNYYIVRQIDILGVVYD